MLPGIQIHESVIEMTAGLSYRFALTEQLCVVLCMQIIWLYN